MANQTNSYRQQRVESLIHSALTESLKRGKMLDPHLINVPLTITKVITAADLKIAHCYFIPFNTNLSPDDILVYLNNCKSAIRNFITEKVKLKYSPEIRFYYDHGFENSYKVEQLLKTINSHEQ